MAADRDKPFLGTGWGFPPEFTRSGNGLRSRLVSREDDINESLRILLFTDKGERIMRPDYGCSLKQMVFEVMEESTITEIQNIVERAILFYEPRITLEFVEVSMDEPLEGKLSIGIEYTVRETNSRSNIVFPYYLQEGTNVRL